MDALHIKRLLYNRRPFFRGLKLHEQSNWRAMAPDMHCSHSLMQNCVYTVSISKKYEYTCNSTTIRLIPLLDRMILLVLKGAEQSHAVNKLCSCTYMYSDIWCTTHLTKFTLFMTILYTSNNSFTANNASIYKNKVG